MIKDKHQGNEFDPVSAYIYGPNQTMKSSGAVSSSEILLFRTRIKPPRGLYVQESTFLGAQVSTGSVVIEMSSMGLGGRMTADMHVKHRNVRYNVKGRLPTDPRQETTLYHCVMSSDPVL